MNREQWWPAKDEGNVLGRFVDVETVDKPASIEAGENRYILKPALESKVAGSADVSCQLLKSFNSTELRARFPGAWEHYEKMREAPALDDKIVIDAIRGTPLHKADFLPRSKMRWLSDQGFTSIEQLRDMSDTTIQNLGRGALSWRKNAEEFLKRT